MVPPFEVIYEATVVRDDIPRLSAERGHEIKRTIEERLTRAPGVFGKPLRHSLKGIRVLRVGDYRVGFRISGEKVIIFGVLHRSVAYREFLKRM